jgi:predicted transposase/invertase (TIGR01784 family)
MDLRKEEGILAYRLDLAEEKGMEKGIQIGEERGEKQAKIAVAKNLLKAGVSVDLIAESTGLPKTEIVQLKEEVTS